MKIKTLNEAFDDDFSWPKKVGEFTLRSYDLSEYGIYQKQSKVGETVEVDFDFQKDGLHCYVKFGHYHLLLAGGNVRIDNSEDSKARAISTILPGVSSAMRDLEKELLYMKNNWDFVQVALDGSDTLAPVVSETRKKLIKMIKQA